MKFATDLSKVKTKNLETLINTISDNKQHFYMDEWFDHHGEFEAMNYKKLTEGCGTAACIAGWCAVLKNKRRIPAPVAGYLESAMEYLGLNFTFADRLCMGRRFWGVSSLKKVTVAKVLKVLRDLLRQAKKVQAA